MSKRNILSAAVVPTVYAIAVFISLEPNPADWGEIGRALFAYLSVALVAGVYFFPGWRDDHA